MNEIIEQLIKSEGWKIVEEMFQVEIKQLRSFKIDWEKDDAIVAREIRTRTMTADIIEKTLQSIKLKGQPLNITKKLLK